MEYFFNIPLIRYIIKQRDMKRAKAELMKMLSELSNDALKYVWRPIAYAYYWTDEHGEELMTDDDVRRMNLICVVAHESPGYVDKLVRARGWLDGCRRRAADEQTD